MQPDRETACFGWLLDKGPIDLLYSHALGEGACKAAAEGNTEVMEFMLRTVRHSVGNRWKPWTSQCMAAAAAGQINMLRWLHAHADPGAWSYHVREAAIQANQLEALFWLHLARDPACELSCANLETAAELGRKDMMQLLRSTDRPCPWDASVCMYAAAQPESLKWLRQQDPPCPWDHRSMQVAAGAGHLSLMQWMRAQDPPCPMTASCMDAAALRGDLAMMKWLRMQEPPCRVNDDCIYSAVEHGSLGNVRWICQQVPSSCRPSSCLWPAIGRGDNNLELVQWMLSHGFERAPWESIWTLNCAGAGGLSMLQWLHGAGYQLDPDCAYRAAAAGHTRLLAWLLSLGTHYCRPDSNLGRRCPTPSPTLMLWADHEHLPSPKWQKQLQCARATFCTFHGLIRWCPRHLSESSRFSHAMQACLHFSSQDDAGQQLLINMASLPNDLVIKIAVAADLQYDPALKPSQSCAA